MLAGIAAFTVAAPAHAATFNVNSTADAGDATPGDGACETATANECTLRAAIDESNDTTVSQDDVINLPSGTYTLTGAPNDDANDSGDLDLIATAQTITIAGAGARTTIINGAGIERVLHILESATAVVRGVTITGGDNSGTTLSDGGGIYLTGPTDNGPSGLTLADSAVVGNHAGDGLLIFAFGDGGGIHAGEGSEVQITRSTIANNSAADDGGGIESDAASTTIENSTIHSNTAAGGADGAGDGGGIEHNEGNLSVVHTTITQNTVPDDGGGIHAEAEDPQPADPPEASFRSTILAANQATAGPNCFEGDGATIASAGTNLESGSDCGFSTAGNLQNSDPLLGPLANNGGPTDTRALGPTSPALHRATTAPCPATDQRSTARPQGPACDIGAYERVLQADVAVTMADSPDPVTPGGNVTYRILAGNGGPDPATGVVVNVNLPSNVTVQSSSIEGGGSCGGTTTLTCNLGNLAPGQTRMVTVVVRTEGEGTETSSSGTARAAQAAGDFEALARIRATEADPNGANNEARVSTSLQSAEEDSEEEEGPGGGDDLGGDVAGTSAAADEGDLPFTGLPLAVIIAVGAWMLGAGVTLRLAIRSLG